MYLDESWVNARDGKEKVWVKDDPTAAGGMKDGIRKTSGKGNRLILLHVGSESGWVDGAALVFQSKKVTGGYHDEMTGQHFEEWFHDTLIFNVQPNIKPKYVVDEMARAAEYEVAHLPPCHCELNPGSPSLKLSVI